MRMTTIYHTRVYVNRLNTPVDHLQPCLTRRCEPRRLFFVFCFLFFCLRSARDAFGDEEYTTIIHACQLSFAVIMNFNPRDRVRGTRRFFNRTYARLTNRFVFERAQVYAAR